MHDRAGMCLTRWPQPHLSPQSVDHEFGPTGRGNEFPRSAAKLRIACEAPEHRMSIQTGLHRLGLHSLSSRVVWAGNQASSPADSLETQGISTMNQAEEFRRDLERQVRDEARHGWEKARKRWVKPLPERVAAGRAIGCGVVNVTVQGAESRLESGAHARTVSRKSQLNAFHSVSFSSGSGIHGFFSHLHGAPIRTSDELVAWPHDTTAGQRHHEFGFH